MMTYSTARRNPYIIGRPIDEPELFFGRESLFQFIRDNLRQDKKIIVLYGQRRIGQSSVIQNIPKLVAPDHFVFVTFDLQDQSQEPFSSILHALITEIIIQLKLDINKITQPSVTELATDIDIFSRQFFTQVYEALGEQKLVLLLKEFNAFGDNNSNTAIEQFCLYLNSIIELQNNLFIILFVRGRLADKPNLLSQFKNAPSQEINLLDESSAKQLITNPAEGVLEYDEDAVRAILELSAGHPYFTQVICFNLFIQARTENNWKVTRENVESIVDKAIESAEAGLAWLWDGMSIPERVVFSAVAEAQKIAVEKSQWVPEEPLTLLKNNGVIPTELLIQAAKQLGENGFLDNTGMRVKVELVRRWLVQRHPLHKEIWQLEKLEQEEVTRIWEEANRLSEQDKKHEVLELYENVLAINPNHFSTVSLLAEEYLEFEDFDKALELYQRAYQVDQISNIEGFVHALETYGHKLIVQREFTKAKEQFNRVLEIEPENVSARKKLKEIAAFEPGSNNSHLYRHKRIPLGGMAAVVAGMIALVSVGFGVYRWSTLCPTGQQKVNGIICQAKPSNISRGESTFFFNIHNPNRDQGIEAFKKRDYKQAVEFFKNAVVANRNDPEALIYYNNARAQQQGSPLTLAVVVPVDNAQSIAQEMLRGVAQAQNQFNTEGGLKGRLLEIAIANDGNDPIQAKQVAQELVKDPYILGVIGHNSSEATRAALREYEQANLAIISPTSSSTYLNSKVFFRTVPSDEVTGKKLAEYLRNLGVTKIVIFYNPHSIYSNSMKKEFTKNFTQLGGQLVRNPIDLSSPTLDVDEEIKTSIAAQAQAALLFPDLRHTSVALYIARSNAKIPKAQRLKLLDGGILYSDKTLTEGWKDVESLIIPVSWFKETPQSKHFAQAAVQQWGGGVSWRTATSFDATQAFIKALSFNPSRSTVLQRLPQVNLPASQTSGEPLEFTPNRERQSKPILVQVEGDGFKQLP